MFLKEKLKMMRKCKNLKVKLVRLYGTTTSMTPCAAWKFLRYQEESCFALLTNTAFQNTNVLKPGDVQVIYRLQ